MPSDYDISDNDSMHVCVCLVMPDISANDGQISKISSWENVLPTWGKPVDQKEEEKQKECVLLIPP